MCVCMCVCVCVILIHLPFLLKKWVIENFNLNLYCIDRVNAVF